jgi:DNA primase
MPGIDYAKVRAAISMSQVLELIQFRGVETSGDEVRGPCLRHKSSSDTSRSFAANLRKHTFRCFKCGAGGNQLDLWVAVSKLPLNEAAKELCDRLGLPVPQIWRW